MFKYVWLIMLGLIYLMLLVRAVKDIIYCIAHRCLYDLDTDTVGFIAFNLMAIFFISLAVFCL